MEGRQENWPELQPAGALENELREFSMDKGIIHIRGTGFGSELSVSWLLS